MLRIIRLLLAVIAAIVIIGFAVANRDPVPVRFAPFPIVTELPIYGVFLFGLVIGVLVGGLSVWFTSFAKRREARRLRHKVWALETQLNVIRQQEEKAQAERYATRRAPATERAASDQRALAASS